MSINEFFTDLNIKAKKRQVVMALFEIKSGSATTVSKKVRLGRTTTYEILNQLHREGLVAKSMKRGSYLFSAKDPESIGQLLENKLAHFQEVLPQLQALYGQIASESSIEVLDQPQAIRHVWRAALRSGSKEHRLLGSLQLVREMLGDLDGYAKERMKQRIFRKSLLLHADKSQKKYVDKQNQYWREVRFLPSSFDFRAAFLTYDTVVIFLLSSKIPQAIYINNESAAKSFRQFFDFLWELS